MRVTGRFARQLRAGVALATAFLVLVAVGASARPSAPKGTHHCGLFRSGHEWIENTNIHGQFYSYGVAHMRCHSGRPLPARVATLALYGQSHVDGFTCTLLSTELKDGYCYRGNPRKPATLKYIVWAPETDCADPNPPYTPAPLPSSCKS